MSVREYIIDTSLNRKNTLTKQAQRPRQHDAPVFPLGLSAEMGNAECSSFSEKHTTCSV